MSLQWTLVATVLYVEIALVLLLVIPWLSPKKWQVLFRSRFLQVLSQQAQWYFGFLVLILALFLLDAIREMRKYSNKEHLDHSHHLESELQMSMRLFRAQRNFYISGFALFLSLVIRRLVTLISTQATLMAEKEAALKQAENVSKTANSLLREKSASEAAENESNESHQEELVKYKAQISLLEDERDKALKNVEAMKKQSEGLQREYDLLTEEHAKLIRRAKIQGGGSGDSKDD